MKKIFMLFLILSIVSGCSSLSNSEFKAYVDADRATYEAVSPEYLEMIEKSDMPDASKKARKNTIETWNIRIRSAEDKVNGE